MSNKIIFIVSLLVFVSNKDFSQVTFTSSNHPIVVINTHGQTIPDEPKITADMGVIDNGPVRGIILPIHSMLTTGKLGLKYADTALKCLRKNSMELKRVIMLETI